MNLGILSGTYVAVDVAIDEPFAETSCHIDCTRTGFEPPFSDLSMLVEPGEVVEEETFSVAEKPWASANDLVARAECRTSRVCFTDLQARRLI